jgi:hypothetical protein
MLFLPRSIRLSLQWIFLVRILCGTGTIDEDVFRLFEVSGGMDGM